MVQVNIKDNKPFYKSKTFWTGTAQTVGGFLLLLAEEVQTGGTLTAAGIVTIALRAVTHEGIEFSFKDSRNKTNN